ncbi:unnamed protein product [Ambrosiozyma monospora]|uniref:cellulase n=1 Tax=Ambrosiozyma monospora TaxID=43982 RepID=A0A9W7DJC7_AMBMO|nr:unnamed protein product [Ambrosiozyma monospora]
MLSQTSLFMLLSSLAVRAAPLADAAPEADSGVASLYYQCGGINWTGATACAEGATCYSQNDYYYQCIATENVPSATAASAASAAAATTTTAEASSSADSGVTSAKIAVQSTSQEESSDNGTSTAAITSTATFKTTFQLAETSSAAQTVDHDVKKSSSAVEQTTSSQAAQQTSSTASSVEATSSSATASSSASESSSSGSSSDLKTVSGGFSGTGKTTRYWDCCLPSYSWPGKSSAVSSPVRACNANGDVLTGTNFQSGCNGGEAYMCNDQVPWAVNDNLAYGFGAASVSGATDETLACSCMKLTFTSTKSI